MTFFYIYRVIKESWHLHRLPGQGLLLSNQMSYQSPSEKKAFQTVFSQSGSESGSLAVLTPSSQLIFAVRGNTTDAGMF